RSIRDLLVPWATAATVPMEQGQITIPALFTDPDAGLAPRSLSSNTFTLDQSPPVAFVSSRSSLMPHSSVSSRQPWVEMSSEVGTWLVARTWRSRTAYGAPEAPVMASVTGRRSTTAPSGLEWGCGADDATAWDGGGVGLSDDQRASVRQRSVP